MKTITEFVSRASIPEGLIRAVVRQAGGWDHFQAIAPAIIKEGASKGWKGFEYHTETMKFFTLHRDLIRLYAHQVATECGRATINMIHDLRCLDDSFTEDDVGIALYGPRSKIDVQIANAVTWFVLDKVAQAYAN